MSVESGYRRSNSESQDYAPLPHPYPPMPGYIIPQRVNLAINSIWPVFFVQNLKNSFNFHRQYENTFYILFFQDIRSIPNNLPPPQHLSQAYSRPQGGMNITGPPSRQQLNRMPRQDAQFNMSRSPMPRHPDPRMHQNQNHGPYTQVSSASNDLHEHSGTQEHMMHHHSNQSPPNNQNSPVEEVSMLGLPPTSNSNLFYYLPNAVGQHLFYPFHQGTQLLQGQFPGFQQVVSPPQVGL